MFVLIQTIRKGDMFMLNKKELEFLENLEIRLASQANAKTKKY